MCPQKCFSSVQTCCCLCKTTRNSVKKNGSQAFLPILLRNIQSLKGWWTIHILLHHWLSGPTVFFFYLRLHVSSQWKKLNRLSSEFDLLISGYIGIFTICIQNGQAPSCYAQVTGWCLVHAFELLLRLRGGRKHLRRQRKPSMVLGFKFIIEQNGKFCLLQTTYSTVFFFKETYFNFPRNNFGGRNPSRTKPQRTIGFLCFENRLTIFAERIEWHYHV